MGLNLVEQPQWPQILEEVIVIETRKAQDQIDSRKNICKLLKKLNSQTILHRRPQVIIEAIKVAKRPLMKAILVARCCRKWVGKKVLALARPIKVVHLS